MSSILTVSQLNRYMAFKLKEDIKLRGLLIKGEISGFTHHMRTGHFYFTLKDGESSVKAVMFSSFASRISFMPQNGMSVIVMGSVQVFERDGVYQIYVTDIQPDGLGAQYLAAEQLKEKLSAEGLFDAAHKKPLPRFPSKIGIVTAKGGAALQDILNILGRRYPVCEAVIFPCVVQGEYAADSICEALKFADECGCDVIICGRGGGSPEDLAAFNSERVARTAFAMQTPVISAVGHETDTTVIDFVSDLRAPTPSAAAELAVPEINTLTGIISGCENALADALCRLIEKKRQELHDREARLREYAPFAEISVRGENTEAYKKRLDDSIRIYLERLEMLVSAKAAELDSLSPLKIMTRGYSLVYKDGRLVKSAAELAENDKVTLKLSDGQVQAIILK